MKILIINWQDKTNPFSGGAETHLHNIFSLFATEFGHEITLYCSSYSEAKNHEVIDGITVIRHGSRSLFNYTVYPAYNTIFSKQNFDLVIDDINKIPFYTPLFVKEPLLGLVHHYFGTSIFREASIPVGFYVCASELLAHKIYRNTPLAVVSKSSYDECVALGYNQNNLHIISNAITHEDFPLEVRSKTPYPSIIYFGRIKKYKAPDHLLESFCRILKDFPSAQLRFMGTGDYEQTLKRMAEDFGITSSVEFLGRVTDAQKIAYLSESWVAVNTSIKEGWGITNVEANACGTPVVCADSPGLRDSINPNKSGMLYEYGNISSLTERLRSVLQNSTMRHDLSVGGVQWAQSFSWRSSAKLMEELCQHTIDAHQSKI